MTPPPEFLLNQERVKALVKLEKKRAKARVKKTKKKGSSRLSQGNVEKDSRDGVLAETPSREEARNCLGQ